MPLVPTQRSRLKWSLSLIPMQLDSNWRSIKTVQLTAAGTLFQTGIVPTLEREPSALFILSFVLLSLSLSHPCCFSVLFVLSLVVTDAITSLLDLPKGKKNSIWENRRMLNIFFNSCKKKKSMEYRKQDLLAPERLLLTKLKEIDNEAELHIMCISCVTVITGINQSRSLGN